MNSLKTAAIIISLSILASTTSTSAFSIITTPNVNANARLSTKLQSFYADSSDYKSSDSDFTSEEESASEFGVPIDANGNEEESPSVEETPVPMSKNAGSRFLAFVYDRALTQDGEISVTELHDNRVDLSEDHVLFCRKANLYNETFNAESMADVLWSNQM
jgi:hypothetical protein